MKHVLVVGSDQAAQDPEQLLFINGIRDALAAEAGVTYAAVEHLVVIVGSGNFDIYDPETGKSLADFDVVVLRSRIRRTEPAYAVSRFCALKNTAYFNDFSNNYSGSKVSQAAIFFEHDAPAPVAIFSINQENLLKVAEKELSLPFILKDVRGAKGRSNYLVHSLDEARSRIADEPNIQFMAQEFCPNDCDYRLLLMPGQHLTIVRRGGSDSHLNNTSAGASAELAQDAVPPQIIQKAHEVATSLGLSFAGVDVMQNRDTGDFFFIEINSQPQVFSGVYLEEKAGFMKTALKQLLDGTNRPSLQTGSDHPPRPSGQKRP